MFTKKKKFVIVYKIHIIKAYEIPQKENTINLGEMENIFAGISYRAILTNCMFLSFYHKRVYKEENIKIFY